MINNRRAASLALSGCIDSYYQYGVITDGFENVSKVATVESDNTLATVYSGPQRRVLAFRGTDDPQDWLENLLMRPEKKHVPSVYEAMRPFVPYRAPAVHGGFYKAYKRLRASLRDILEEYSEEGVRWLVTGHSLGGALANIACMSMAWERGPDLVTFGSPRWGNQHAAWIVSQKTRLQLRFINNNDIVPLLPAPVGPWTHSAPAIHVHGDNRGPISSHLIFDYRTGLTRYNGLSY